MYAAKGVCTGKLLHWSGVSHSSFYYKPSGKPKGIKPSTHTVNTDGVLMENKVVINDIEKTLHQEFCCYGYHNMSSELKEKGWIINHKKVHRLMRENHLLYGCRVRPQPFKRNFIRFRSPIAEKPLQYLSMDIKYVHIHGWGRNVFLLTVMDIYSRKFLSIC